MTIIGSKADFRDLDTLSQKLHAKCDTDKLKSSISELREETTKTLAKAKKETVTSQKKRDDDIDKLRAEMDVLHAKTQQDHTQTLEKL
jgi:PDZ domain-containing secreted protein